MIQRRLLLSIGLPALLVGQSRTEAAVERQLVMTFGSLSDARSSVIGEEVAGVRLAGYYMPGDGGESDYHRVSAQPQHAGCFRSADGAFWELAATPTVRPEQFGARGDAVPAADGFMIVEEGTDDQSAFDGAVGFLEMRSGGGSLELGPRTYHVSRGVRLSRNISLVGRPGVSRLYKSGRGLMTVRPQGVAAGGIAAVSYSATSLPTEIDAVLVLDGEGGRWIGRIQDVVLQGALSDPSDWESQATEFGLVSVGSVSDSVIAGVTINLVRHAMLMPDIFTSQIVRNRASNCLAGFAVNKGTALTYSNNYASNCRDYGHVFRDLLYSSAFGNAVDNLNDPTFYKNRTRLCRAYVLAALDGFRFTANGQEQTFGSSYFLDVLHDCLIESNVVIGLGSDYGGVAPVAVWEMTGFENNTSIRNNPVLTFSERGLLHGRARPENHHFVYCGRDVTSQPARVKFQFEDNVVRQFRFGDPGGGWVNDVTPGWAD